MSFLDIEEENHDVYEEHDQGNQQILGVTRVPHVGGFVNISEGKTLKMSDKGLVEDII